jgi:hypothetical protein
LSPTHERCEHENEASSSRGSAKQGRGSGTASSFFRGSIGGGGGRGPAVTRKPGGGGVVGAEEQRRRFLSERSRQERTGRKGGKNSEDPDDLPYEEYDTEGRVNALELARRLRLALEEGPVRRNLRPNMCYYSDTPAEELSAAQTALFTDSKPSGQKRHLW